MRHLLIAVPVVLAAWAWFGAPGAVPVMIWCWHRRPAQVRPGRAGATAASWHIDLSRVSRARLGPWRTWIACRGVPAVEIFSDEIHSRDLAQLRREVKARLAGSRGVS